jgi:hypothetical protein
MVNRLSYVIPIVGGVIILLILLGLCLGAGIGQVP